MPYWCTDCRSYFSVKTGTVMQSSKLPLRKWAIGNYSCQTSLKSVSSIRLRRDLKIGKQAAWFMLHRIQEARSVEIYDDDFQGPVEADESYFGGRRSNMSNAQRKALKDTGRAGLGSGETGVAGRHNMRESGTLAQMRDVVARMIGRRLRYAARIADNGLSSGARA